MPEGRFRRAGIVPNWWIALQICEFVGMVAVAGAIARLASDGVSQPLLWFLGIGTIVAVFVLNRWLRKRFVYRGG
ncbi:MAG: hypothetical protein ABI572_11650 [Actinomycetota bacterium]